MDVLHINDMRSSYPWLSAPTYRFRIPPKNKGRGFW